MAKRYPVILNGVRFLVNPKHFTIRKPLSLGELLTGGGVQFQSWFDLPEILTISGQSAGSTAFKELQFLNDNFARTNKTSELYYKNRLYRGIIREMTVEADITHLHRYNYTIPFQLLQGEKFAMEDFALKATNLESLKGEVWNTWVAFVDEFKNIGIFGKRSKSGMDRWKKKPDWFSEQ